MEPEIDLRHSYCPRLVTSLSTLSKWNRKQIRMGERNKSDQEEGLAPSRASYWWTCGCGLSHVRSTSLYVAPPCKCGGTENRNVG